MQRRHSSNTDGAPPERTRSQTVGSETSLDEGGVFEGLKPEPPSTQQLFSGLVGLPSGNVSSASFQAAGLVMGSPPVYIQMSSSSREEGAHQADSAPYQPQHHHNHHHFHQPPPHRSSLLHAAAPDRQGNGEDGPEDPSTPAPALSELRAVISWLQKGLPFILILLVKLCFQHKLGIAVCIGMASTFACANSTLKHQVSLRASIYCECASHAHREEKRSVLVSFWIVAFLAGNTFYLYYTFSSEELYNSLIFVKPNLDDVDFFDLMWVVGITDFVLKYFTMSLKCIVLVLPRVLLAFKSRGKFYLVIEELSQLFRALVPIQLWYKYIMGGDASNSYLLGGVLLILYSLSKTFDVCGRVGALRKAMKMLCISQSCGVRASSQQCSEAGDVCAICQAEFRDPVMLMCQHVFCDECVCLWFDCERTCPLCRSAVIETLRYWKDGTTSAHFQVY
ncbi:RNFT2 protein, partial [Polyodon spathula]|nr:RNFT2 protein [Polyodon spathula]